jgi:hypothetical protein
MRSWRATGYYFERDREEREIEYSFTSMLCILLQVRSYSAFIQYAKLSPGLYTSG